MNKNITSESTKDLTASETERFRNLVKNMSPAELEVLRSQFQPDSMGFNGSEGVDDED